MQVVTEVKKWGNSLGVIIPKEAAKRLNIKAGEKISADILRRERVDAFGITKGSAPFKEEELIRKKFDFKERKGKKWKI